MFLDLSNVKIYLRLGATDMRKAINGLAVMVEDEMELDPFSGHLFVFCNKRKRNLKILYWDKNGFCLWQKRLEKHKFKWPRTETETLAISTEQFNWLLRGIDFRSAHEELKYESMF